MLNPIASEAIFSATYVDNYLDSVENLPDDVQRQLSRIRDIDAKYHRYLRDVDHYYDLWKTLQNSGDTSANRRARAISRMQQSLIQAQELGDEKMQVVNQLQELIDHKTRQLDSDQKNLDIKEEEQQQQDDVQGATATPQKVPRTQSPPRDSSAAVNGSICVADANTVNSTKDQSHAYAINASGASNCVTPTIAERTSGHVSSDNGTCTNTQLNPARGPVSSNAQAVTNNNQTLNTIIATSEPQRSASKRSRRRNDTVNQNHLEIGGNESNSNNETGSGSGDKNTLGNSVSTQKSTATGIGGGSGLTQKKNSIHGHGQSGSGTSASVSGGSAALGASSTTISGSAGSGTAANTGKKKKRKARGAQAANAQNTREDTPPLDPIDPDEPTYCLCAQISFGEMILCDNDLCPIEWFHFSCVSLVLKPKGKWYCPNCRGDRPNVMKPKAQFLKELERYNKEKEEKT